MSTTATPEVTYADPPEEDINAPVDAAAPETPEAEAPESEDAPEDNRAAEYGLDPADFASPEAMDKAIAAIDKQLAAFGRGQTNESPLGKTPEAKETPAETETPAEDDLTLDPEIYEEGLVKAFNGLKSRHAAEVKSLRDEVAQLRQFHQSQQAQQAEQMLDGYFDSLGDEFRETFGKGGIRSLKPDSKEAQARIRFAEELDALAAGDHKAGRKMTSFDALAKRALRSAFGDTVEKISQKKITAQASQRRGQALSRPTQRGGKPINGEQAAGQFADRFYQEKGIPVPFDVDEDRAI